jgi:hypothetical protein
LSRVYIQKQSAMKSVSNNPLKERDRFNKDASQTNKTDKFGAFVDEDGRSKNYKGGDATINGPNFNETSEAADGDTSSNAGVSK